MRKKVRRILILFFVFIFGVIGFSCLMNSQNTDNKTDLQTASIPCMAMKICEVLKVTPYELLGENETERNAGNPEMSAGNETEKIILEGFRNLSDRKKERILGYLAALQED